MAPRGKVTQLDHHMVADFETTDIDNDLYTTLKDGTKINNQRVWLWGLQNLETGHLEHGTNIASFMERIVSRGTNQNTEIGFHNLKFDGSFIVPWLFENDYEYVTQKPKKGEFSLLVDERNSWYSLTIQVTTKRKVTIWDTAKLFPAPLEYLPDIYNTPTKKLIEDQHFYTKHRTIEHVPTAHEMKYLYNDLQVLRETLLEHIAVYGLHFKKTQASQSFHNFEQTFKAWKWRFPGLSEEVDQQIRTAYWGGISYVQPIHAGKDVSNIRAYDINSSYPHKASDRKLPYGEPIAQYGQGIHPDNSKFWIAEALVQFKLKDYHLPCIPAKSLIEGRPFDIGKWVDDSHGIVKIVLSSIDFQTALQSYEIEVISWNWSIHWKQRLHKEVAKFVYKNNDDKEHYRNLANSETDPDTRNQYLTIANRAKIDNNSFYGKFGEEIIKYSKNPEQDNEKGVKWSVGDPDIQTLYKRKFLPVAIAITAYGRQQLVEFANLLGKDFLYCDTDSVYYLQGGEKHVKSALKSGKIEVDSTKLGAWSHDGDYSKGRFLRAKCYMVLNSYKNIETTIAGLPSDKNTGQFSKTRSCLDWSNFQIGTVIPPNQSNKLASIRTKTGTKLVPVAFTIKEKDFSFN